MPTCERAVAAVASISAMAKNSEVSPSIVRLFSSLPSSATFAS
jgi:hypothetical protein